MKMLGRTLLIAGLLTVLQPCACDQMARILASSCPMTGHDCCGGTQHAGIHQSMDQKASITEAVQIHPPVIILQVPAFPRMVSVVTGTSFAGYVETGPSPPSVNRPLLI